MTPGSSHLRQSQVMMVYLFIALGGALGSVGRFALGGVVSNQMGIGFPWGTLFVNVTGSFVIGFFSTLTDPSEGRLLAGPNLRQFVLTGICGGYTTFSSFSLNTLNLARDGEWFRAGGNVVGSVILCLVAVWLGHLAASWINLHRGA
jgi:fluoride exporter